MSSIADFHGRNYDEFIGIAAVIRLVMEGLVVLLAAEEHSGCRAKLTQDSLRCNINPAVVLAYEKSVQSGTAKDN